MTEAELERLGTHGWFQRSAFEGATRAAEVVVDRGRLFVPAGISRGHEVDVGVRDDTRLWVDTEDAQLQQLVGAFEALRVEINASAWLGLTRFELQLARFEAGGRYVRHRDALVGQNNRRVTAIAYLNPAWTPKDGGQLRLYAEPTIDIAPELGRLVVFMSERIEHEVLPSLATRFAATAWYYGC